MTLTPDTPGPEDQTPAAPLSVWGRAVAIFTNPTGAWVGLERRAQWWFPLAVMMAMTVVFTVTLHERALVPMITEQYEQMVDRGEIPAEQLDRIEAGLRGPMGMVLSAAPQVIAWPIIMLLIALGISFGVGFVLGTKMGYRRAFEVANWSSLILIPSYVLTWALAWMKESVRDIHVGLGILVPAADPPQRLTTALAAFLDAFGPFSIWCLVVAILGASALSGAPRKSVAWVLGGLYVVLAIFMAAMAAIFTPGT